MARQGGDGPRGAQRIRSVLEWAIAMDLRNDNPCDRVLPHKDVAAAIETVRASGSTQPAVRLEFEFLVLTAARTLGDGKSLVFPMRSGKTISMLMFPKMLQYHRIAAVAHGGPRRPGTSGRICGTSTRSG